MEAPEEKQLTITVGELAEFNLSRVEAYLREFLGDGAYVIKEEVFVARIRQYATDSQFRLIMSKLSIDWEKYDQPGFLGLDEEHWF